jgi:hypothetical protein
MPESTCTFDLVNTNRRPLTLILEPEGAQFVLPAGEVIQIRVSGTEPAVAIKHTIGEDDQVSLSFWPDQGAYELFFKGRNVWDLM